MTTSTATAMATGTTATGTAIAATGTTATMTAATGVVMTTTGGHNGIPPTDDPARRNDPGAWDRLLPGVTKLSATRISCAKVHE
ncbi:Uncharacterised protein [Mycobacteroides abscessus subsp. abscessus]|nr:Uncharacterised protein [Mycobacteroides abscessus subsp. abscessus]